MSAVGCRGSNILEMRLRCCMIHLCTRGIFIDLTPSHKYKFPNASPRVVECGVARERGRGKLG